MARRYFKKKERKAFQISPVPFISMNVSAWSVQMVCDLYLSAWLFMWSSKPSPPWGKSKHEWMKEGKAVFTGQRKERRTNRRSSRTWWWRLSKDRVSCFLWGHSPAPHPLWPCGYTHKYRKFFKWRFQIGGCPKQATIWSSNSTSQYASRKLKAGTQPDIRTCGYHNIINNIISLIIIAKWRKQPRCSPTD